MMAILGQDGSGTSQGPRLLEQVRDALRRRHYSYRAEQS